MGQQSNSAKWKNFADGQVLHGQSGAGQNLNDDLQKRIADELDAAWAELIGDGVVSGMAVTLAGGLAVNIDPGTIYILGQRVRTGALFLLTGLPATQALIRVYIEASVGYDSTQHAWPAMFGKTTGVLTTGQLFLAEVSTDGSTVTGIVDRRSLIKPLGTTLRTLSKARLASLGVL